MKLTVINVGSILRTRCFYETHYRIRGCIFIWIYMIRYYMYKIFNINSIVQLKVPLGLKGVKTAAVANVWSYDTKYILLTGKMAFKIFRQKLGIRDNQIRNIKVFKKLVISRKTYLGVYEISPVQDTDIYL